MIGLGKSRANKLILFGLVLLCLCFLLASVVAYGSYKAHKRFAKHLYKFLKEERYFLKKKGIEAAALFALTSMGKKKIPIPLPLPIPYVASVELPFTRRVNSVHFPLQHRPPANHSRAHVFASNR